MKKFMIGCGSIFAAFLLVGACVAAIGGDDTTSTNPAADEAKDKEEKPKTANIGDKVKAGEIAYTITKVETKNKLSNSLGEAQPGSGQFALLTVEVENLGKKAITVDSSMTLLIEPDGSEYEPSTDAMMYLPEESAFLEQINPKGNKTYTIVYDIPKEDLSKFKFKGTGGLIFSGESVLIELKK